MEILICSNCLLLFRWPVDTHDESYRYYQKEYASGPTTELPNPDMLSNYMTSNFADTPLDLSRKIQVLKAIRPRGRVLDYGCSWGYGVAQLRAAGYEAVGFEISKPRAAFGREKLRVEILDADAIDKLQCESFDIVLTNHVLEHLSNLSEVLDFFGRILVRDGVAFHFLPNFTGRTARAGAFWQWIGRDHPIAPTSLNFHVAQFT